MAFAMVIIARHDTELNNPWEPLMRRDVFLKSLAAAALLGSASMQARASATVKMMIPANPGGGWVALRARSDWRSLSTLPRATPTA